MPQGDARRGQWNNDMLPLLPLQQNESLYSVFGCEPPGDNSRIVVNRKPCQRLAVTLLRVAVSWKSHHRRWPETSQEIVHPCKCQKHGAHLGNKQRRWLGR